jgi:hypothetical protein
MTEQQQSAQPAIRKGRWELVVVFAIGGIGGVSLHHPLVQQKFTQLDAASTCVLKSGNPLPVNESAAPLGVKVHGVTCSFNNVVGFISFNQEMEKRYPEAPMALWSLLRN